MDQSNKTRYIYTLGDKLPPNAVSWCRLRHNDFYFTRETKSDEKIVYTERILHSIVRAFLFLVCSNARLKHSLEAIVESGQVDYCFDKNDYYSTTLRFREDYTIADLVYALDAFFGENFAAVANRVVTTIYDEYWTKWRYWRYESTTLFAPLVLDIVSLYRFYNLVNCRLSAHTQFVIDFANRDNRVPLQSRIKRVTG